MNTTTIRRTLALLLAVCLALALGCVALAAEETASCCETGTCTMPCCAGDTEDSEESACTCGSEATTGSTTADAASTTETVSTMTISEDETSGYIGNSTVTWTLQNGVLTIGGSGSTDTFTSKADQPWAVYRDEIQQVWFEDMEAVSIANLAYWFTDCVNLETAEVPYTTPVIGTAAFAGCESLQTVLLYYEESDPLTIVPGAFALDELDLYADPLTVAVAALHESITDYDWMADNRQVLLSYAYGLSLMSTRICGGCNCAGGTGLSLCETYTYDVCKCSGSSGGGSSGGDDDEDYDYYDTYSVTFSLSNLTQSGGGSYAYSDTNYTATLVASTGYSLPSSITVTVGGSTLSTSRYTYNSSTGSISIPSSYIYGNIVITATGVASSYTITWNGNGGTSYTTTQTYGQTLTLPSTPSRTGYTFSGWYTAASGGTQVTASTVFTGTSNTTYYAHWSIRSYTVTWDASTNGGTIGGNSSTTTSVSYGSTATAPTTTPVKTGHTFKGWYTTATGSSLYSSVTVTAARTFYAQYTANSYTITWNGNGGTSSTSTQTYGETLTLPTTPTRAGYTFDGWYTSASGGTKVTASTVFSNTSATTYYAHWSIRSYTVTWDASTNGGTIGGNSFTTTSVSYGSAATAPTTTPIKTGHTFKGWYTTATGSSLYSSVTVTAARTFYAQFTANDYSITWDLGDGKTETTSQTYGEALNLPSTPSKTGYTFDGWYTEESSGTKVTDSTIFTGTTDTTYYAHWTAETYSIHYYNENGEEFDGTQADGYPTTHTYGTTTSLPDASKEGYYFLGWYTDADCTNRVTELTATSYTADISLYAKWEFIEIFSVTVPSSLTLSIAQDGTVYAGTNAEIVNSSTGAVKVSSLTVTANNGWTLVPFDTDMAAQKVDSKLIGFSVNGAETTKTGSEESLSLSGSWTIQENGSMPLDYTANISAMSQPVTDANVLTLVFVLEWAE